MLHGQQGKDCFFFRKSNPKTICIIPNHLKSWLLHWGWGFHHAEFLPKSPNNLSFDPEGSMGRTVYLPTFRSHKKVNVKSWIGKHIPFIPWESVMGIDSTNPGNCKRPSRDVRWIHHSGCFVRHRHIFTIEYHGKKP